MFRRCRGCQRVLAPYEAAAGVCEPCGELRCNRLVPRQSHGWLWLTLLLVAAAVLGVCFLWYAGANHAGNG